MKRISKETIDRIQEEVSIIEVMEHYTKIVKKGYGGNAYTGFCPFHNDVRNPSLSINADKKIFYCFTCNEAGNLFQFIQKIEGIGFADSVKLLGDRYNIPIIYDNPGDPGYEEERTSFFNILKDADEFYHNELSKSSEAQKYLSQRNFSEDTIKTWNLGWAAGNRTLFNYLVKKGYKKEDLVTSGLISYVEEKNEYRDVFFSRVVFPIKDVLGRTIGFGGRTLEPNGKPKYLNSKENPIFHKRKTLFGMNVARKRIQEKDEVLVTEGYVDTIMLHQHGINNAVAALGTAFTTDHILLLSRMTKNIYLSLDADKAGRTAARRAIELLENTDASLYVVEIPLDMAKDPDEFLQKYSAEEFIKIKDQAISIQKFIVKSIFEEYDLESSNAKERAYNDVIAFLQKYRKTFTMFQGIEVCDYITSRLGMPFSGYELYQNVIKNDKKQSSNDDKKVDVISSNLLDLSLELNLIRLLADYSSFGPMVKEIIEDKYFTTDETRDMYNKIINSITSGATIDNIVFEDETLNKTWNKFQITHPSIVLTNQQAEQSIQQAINALKRLYLEKRLEKLEFEGKLDEVFQIKMELAKIPRTI